MGAYKNNFIRKIRENYSFTFIDFVSDNTVITPNDGDIYIVSTGINGFNGHNNEIAIYNSYSTSWDFIIPQEGWNGFNNTSKNEYLYKNSVWEVNNGVPCSTYTNSNPVPTTIGGISSGSTFNAKTMKEMWDALLYPYQYPSFTSFSLSGYSTLEVGSSIPSGNVTFTWSTSNSSNIKTNTINIIDVTNGNDTLLSNIANDGNESYNLSSTITKNSATYHQFKIQATNSQSSVFSTTYSVQWQFKRYSGVSSSSSLTNSDILAMSSEFATGYAQTKTFDCTGGKYIYIIFPSSFSGTPVFKVGGLTAPFNESSISHTNASGFTSTYKIFRSTNIQNGSSITVVVS